ncbi:MAG: DUF2905 domain-containing protein [bacterium]
MAKWLIIIGILLVIFGLGVHFTPWLFSWFGRLPGDIRVESENSKFIFPLTSMIIISVVLSVIFSLIFNLFKH